MASDHDSEAAPSSDANVLGAAPQLGLAEELARRRIMANVLGVPAEPLRVGRFVLEVELGSGGMGTVWRAFDEQLGRAVAIKFLHGEGELGEPRLLEEAQALAALSHPNVVPIYDVGRHEGRVWLAMELVEGRTLRAWVAGEQPGRAQILAAWLEAGRGLAAVHAAGLVHRDVKPDNVQLGDDGRVRLLDFGLVRGLPRDASSPGAEPTTVASSGGSGRAAHTQTGAFVGTRAYAAPEQLAGSRVDARADQYAFCVSLYEALIGVRPRRVPLAPGERVWLPAGQRLPRSLRAALSRGLARELEARFTDMDELLAALERRRPRWLLPAALGLALLGGGAAGVYAATSMSEPALAPCRDATRAIDEVFGEQRRTQLLAGQPTVSREAVAAALDDWAGRWRTAARTACEEVHVEQTRSPESLDRRRACLDAHLSELGVVLEALEREPRRVAVLGTWLAGLGDPGACLSQAVLDRRAESPTPAQAERAEALRRKLFALWVGADPRPLGDRRLAAAALLGEVEALALPSLEGFALDVLADLALRAGDLDGSRRWAGALFDHATDNDDAALRAEAWLQLATIELDLALDVDRASWLAGRHARAVRQLGDPPVLLGEAKVLQGHLALVEGAYAQAEVELRSAVDAFARAGSAADVSRSRALRNLALVAAARGRKQESSALLDEAAALERFAEPDARACSRGLQDATTRYEAGEPEQAEAEAALEACTRERGPSSEAVADLHGLLAALAIEQGRLDEGREHALAADAIYRTNFAPGHAAQVSVLSTLATAEFYAGHFAEAVPLYRRAMQLAERSSTIAPQERALARANLGEALLAVGDAGAARAMLEAAIASLEGLLGPEHVASAIPRKALAAALLEQGELASARSQAELARGLLEAEGSNFVELAHTRWLLARIELARGERDRARALAEEALGQLESFGSDFEAEAGQLRAWLSSELQQNTD